MTLNINCSDSLAIGSTVTISNISYVIERCDTVRSMRGSGYDHYADKLASEGVVADVILRRPKGKKLTLARAFDADNGTFAFTIVCSL